MAAITPQEGTETYEIIGRQRVVGGRFAAPTDGDTWNTGLTHVDRVDLSFNDAATVAADSMAYTVDGGVVTFEIAGTGRAFTATAWGF